MKRILISRTDSIGDVVLTLPMCQAIRKQFPEAQLIYIGKKYTEPVVQCFDCIDEFWDVDSLLNQPIAMQIEQMQADCIIHVFPNKKLASLAKKAKIPMRIGTSHRVFHLFSCNYRPNFTRKKSPYHEAQLNFHLLQPLGITSIPNWDELTQLLEFSAPMNQLTPAFQWEKESYVLLHPKSKGSALEWPIAKYVDLAEQLAHKGTKVCFTGTEEEGQLFRKMLPVHPNIIDSSGKLSLSELICLIDNAKALVACSTGPYHIAGVCGVKAIGLFSMRRPIDPGRWQAIGPKAKFLVFDPHCSACKKGEKCRCIEEITVQSVINAIA
ncbi:MAG: glycosyltransferase family 9 protein [Crocinitomicaceae bacterium]